MRINGVVPLTKVNLMAMATDRTLALAEEAQSDLRQSIEVLREMTEATERLLWATQHVLFPDELGPPDI